MESIIKRNLSNLCIVTTVDTALLTFLYEKDIITWELKQIIEHEVTDIKKGDLLYSHLIKRPEGDFDVILEGLEKSNNKRAIEILKGNKEDEPGTSGASTSKSNFNLGRKDDISYLKNFKKTQVNLKWPMSHGIKDPVKNFAGRDEEITKLQSFYKNNKNLVLVCGLGGLGKTEFCRKLLHNLDNQFLLGFFKRNNGVSRVWLSGDTFESLKTSVFSFATELGVTNDLASPSQMFEYLTKMTLEHCKKLVVVVDNVDVKIDEVSKVIQMVSSYKNTFTIVTSRDRMILDNAGERMELDVLSQVEARNILQSSIENLSDSDADSLSKLVQYYPLALQQAIAYVKVQQENYKTSNYSVSDYLKEFNQKKAQMLDHKLNEYEHNYSKTTLVTWDITYDKLSSEAKEFLKILAFLNPDKISVTFFEDICMEFGYKRKCEESVNMLRNYSLIKVDNLLLSIFRVQENLVISIHRLVQDVMREKAESGFAKKLFNVVAICLARPWRSVLNLLDNRDSHMEKISELAYGTKFRVLVLDYASGSDNSNDILLGIKSRLALKLSEINNHSDCLEVCSEVLSSNSKPNVTYRNAFEALILLSKNHSTRPLVVKLLENSLEFKKLTLGDNHEITTNFKIILAVVLETGERKLELINEIRNYYDFNKRGIYSYYEKLFLSMIIGEDWLTRDKIYRYVRDCSYTHLDLHVLERLLAFYKEVLGDNDKLTVEVKNIMALKLYRNAEYDKSLKLIEQVFNSNIQSEFAEACGTINLIAKHFYDNGNYKEAKPLFERVIKFSKYQSYVIDAKYLLANILFKLDCDLTYARDLFCELLFYYEEGQGKNHFGAKKRKEKMETLLKLSK